MIAAALGVIAVYKMIRSGNIDIIKLFDLRLASLDVESQIQKLNSELKIINRGLTKILEQSKESEIENDLLILKNRIKNLKIKYKNKNNTLIQLQRQQRAINNIIILKEHESYLKKTGAWKKLKKISPAKLEKWLEKKSLLDDRDTLVRTIISMTSEEAEKDIEEDKEFDEISDIINRLKEGKLKPGDAVKEVIK